VPILAVHGTGDEVIPYGGRAADPERPLRLPRRHRGRPLPPQRRRPPAAADGRRPPLAELLWDFFAAHPMA
jgi:hypothetical protein